MGGVAKTKTRAKDLNAGGWLLFQSYLTLASWRLRNLAAKSKRERCVADVQE